MRNENTTLSTDELFAKYEPNPSELLKAHDTYNARTGFNVSMPGLRTRDERAATYAQWAKQDADALAKAGA